jgi:hypothetical protein
MTDRPERPLRAPPSAFRLNLEQQKNRAKDLLRAAKSGDAEAIARMAPAPGAELKLAHAQFAIARELRFASWAKLKEHIASMERQWHDIEQKLPALDGDLKTLHVRCGHDIQQTLVEAGCVGDFYPHITPYCQGPVTNGPDRLELMARFIAEEFGGGVLFDGRVLEYEAVLDGERRQHETLVQSAQYDRAVLWMEHDNYDQLVLIRLLAHYADHARPRLLELIAVGEFPGGERFLGVGQLPPEALRLLWPTRKPVTHAQLDLGKEAWNALASPDPRALAAIARSGTPALPLLSPALARHLRELPSTVNGLSLAEQLILEIVLEKESPMLNQVFWTLTKGREPLYFIGDGGVARMVRDMEHASEPPLVRTIGSPGERLFANRLTLTNAGRDVLRGVRDWHTLGPRPRWVGGVHIVPGKPGWRWNEARGEPVMVEV